VSPSLQASETTSALPSFRWPVRGKVITSYGAKTNEATNDRHQRRRAGRHTRKAA